MMASVCERLAEDFKLSATDPRVEQAGIYKANQLLWEQRIASGEAIPSAELSSYSDIVERLLGKPAAAPLKVRFVYVCFHCQTESEVDPDTLCAKCQAELPPKPERGPVELMHASEPPPVSVEPAAPADASEAPPAPAPVNVEALHHSIHSDPHAPLAHRDEPWRSHLQGERSGFRRFDIPKNF
jgi:hypothetical protein